MTQIPARLIRPQTDICSPRPPAKARDSTCRAYIVEAAGRIFATHGRNGITLANFADATGLSAATVRRHVCDMHHVFGLILHRHLNAILAAIEEIPSGGPDYAARRRAEYFRITRDPSGLPTRTHILLTQSRFALPPDELGPVETHRRTIAALLGGEAALDMLDCASMDLEKIEAASAAILAVDSARNDGAQPTTRATTQPPAQTSAQTSAPDPGRSGATIAVRPEKPKLALRPQTYIPAAATRYVPPQFAPPSLAPPQTAAPVCGAFWAASLAPSLASSLAS